MDSAFKAGGGRGIGYLRAIRRLGGRVYGHFRRVGKALLVGAGTAYGKELIKLIDEALSLAEETVWALDQPGGSAALLLALLWQRDQRVRYVPGLTVDRARDAYRGESKTDARDARIIAYPKRGCAQTSASLEQVNKCEEELQLLLARRRDLVTDQTRSVTRLRREALLSLFPALQRALDLNSKGPLILLTHYQTPAQLRRALATSA